MLPGSPRGITYSSPVLRDSVADNGVNEGFTLASLLDGVDENDVPSVTGTSESGSDQDDQQQQQQQSQENNMNTDTNFEVPSGGQQVLKVFGSGAAASGFSRGMHVMANILNSDDGDDDVDVTTSMRNLLKQKSSQNINSGAGAGP